MAVVTVTSVNNMTHLVTSDHHRIVADEPPPTGDDEGMDPYELLLASLGS
jgi:putative redox protein